MRVPFQVYVGAVERSKALCGPAVVEGGFDQCSGEGSLGLQRALERHGLPRGSARNRPPVLVAGFPSQPVVRGGLGLDGELAREPLGIRTAFIILHRLVEQHRDEALQGVRSKHVPMLFVVPEHDRRGSALEQSRWVHVEGEHIASSIGPERSQAWVVEWPWRSVPHQLPEAVSVGTNARQERASPRREQVLDLVDRRLVAFVERHRCHCTSHRFDGLQRRASRLLGVGFRTSGSGLVRDRLVADAERTLATQWMRSDSRHEQSHPFARGEAMARRATEAQLSAIVEPQRAYAVELAPANHDRRQRFHVRSILLEVGPWERVVTGTDELGIGRREKWHGCVGTRTNRVMKRALVSMVLTCAGCVLNTNAPTEASLIDDGAVRVTPVRLVLDDGREVEVLEELGFDLPTPFERKHDSLPFDFEGHHLALEASQIARLVANGGEVGLVVDGEYRVASVTREDDSTSLVRTRTEVLEFDFSVDQTVVHATLEVDADYHCPPFSREPATPEKSGPPAVVTGVH